MSLRALGGKPRRGTAESEHLVVRMSDDAQDAHVWITSTALSIAS